MVILLAVSFFSVDVGMYRWQLHQILCGTLPKTEVKLVLSPGLLTWTTYTSGLNWYILVSLPWFTVSFANSPFTAIDTAIIRGSLIDVLKNSAKFKKRTCAGATIKLSYRSKASNVIEKETVAQVFSYEFWEIFMNTFL